MPILQFTAEMILTLYLQKPTLRFLLYVLLIFITVLIFLLYVLFSQTRPVKFISTGLIIET
jgi:hypothetical protein